MAEIIPAIIADSYQELKDKIKQIEPHVTRIHVDIMDGIFVTHKTIDGPEEVEKLDTPLSIEVHLMVQKPENKIVRWLSTQADKFLVHIESTTKFQEVIDFVKEQDKTIFAVVNPQTPYKSLENIIDYIDGVQFMTVEPGQYGAEFQEDVIKKIEEFKYFYPDMAIEVDGAIHKMTAQKCVAAGASILAVGSHIFTEGGDIKPLLDELALIN